VIYLRGSTPEQAEKDLSIPAQRKAVAAYAERNGKSIDREYLEPGRSGTDINRKAFRQMLEDVLWPGSDIGVIVVHHTSRFTRNATQARVVKEQLRRKGVKVMVVMDQYTRRIIGFGVQSGDPDGAAVCRMFNQAIAGMGVSKYLSTDNDPLYRFHRCVRSPVS
jgi:transposase InsO family protein